jgi:putative aminopeptidase FrvX
MDDEVTFIFAPMKHKITIPNPWIMENGDPNLDIFFKTQEVVLKKIEEPIILAAVSTATATSLPYEYLGCEPSPTASSLAPHENTDAFECVPSTLNPTGHSEKIEEQDGIITVTTDNNYYASYQLMTDRFAVTVGNKIKVTYDIKVENGGQMCAGLLNTTGDGWIGAEIVMPTGSYHNSFEVTVPEGERNLCLVLRNYHLGRAGQTTFTVNHLNIMKTK